MFLHDLLAPLVGAGRGSSALLLGRFRETFHTCVLVEERRISSKYASSRGENKGTPYDPGSSHQAIDPLPGRSLLVLAVAREFFESGKADGKIEAQGK